MHIYKTRHEVHTSAVEFFITCVGFYIVFGVMGHSWVACLSNLCNAVVFYHNVHWANRRRTSAVDNGDSPNNEAFVRAIAFGAVGCFLDLGAKKYKV